MRQFPRAAATPTPPNPALNTAPADVAGGRGNRFDGIPVSGIDPVNGFTLMVTDEDDGEGFVTALYFARGADGDQVIHHSRFRFNPTQARFNALVALGFPPTISGFPGPIVDADIDKWLRSHEACRRIFARADGIAS
ncbi:hypothetical protein [Novosphingobium sp. FKTRR1]|uniref:hypothetical protein n=1 Tax=Novosphingobium sp. FKTRR1 TaxID=2879118 RepID=UPI001CEFBD0E|nr:hypothetical protein [Novosphingobium sp. FKTRR1]